MLELIQILLGSLSAIAADPALGPRGRAVKAVLDLAATALAQGAEGAAELKQLSEDLKNMVAEGRNPTDEEWADLKARSDTAHGLIQNWRP